MFYALRRSRLLGGLLVALLLVSATGLMIWLIQTGDVQSPLRISAAACIWWVAAASAFHGWFFQPSGGIRWDGMTWTLEASSSGVAWRALSGPPEVVLDLQSHLWLCVIPVGHRRTWIWLECSAQPERWLDLRRAVYSRAKPGADNADETALASSRGRES